MSWHLAPALDRLRDEVNAKWPNRSKASDGTIGDAAHSSRTSDHNPNSRRSVNAIDITAKGISTDTLIAAAKKHPSVRYIIFNRRIMNRDIGNFRSRPYSGSNPHTQHVHISLYQRRSAEDDTRSWGLGKPSSSKPVPAKPKPAKRKAPGPGYSFPWPAGHYIGPKSGPDRSHSGFYSHRTAKGKTDQEWIKEFVAQLGRRGWSVGKGKTWLKKFGNDGKYGNELEALIRAFQSEQGLDVDGLAGRSTWDEAFKGDVT